MPCARAGPSAPPQNPADCSHRPERAGAVVGQRFELTPSRATGLRDCVIACAAGRVGPVPLLPLRATVGSVLALSLAIWGFAVAQPLYDLLARSPEFLVAHGLTPMKLAALILSISVIAPALLAGLIWLTGKANALAGSLVQLGWVGLGASAVVLPFLGRVEALDGWLGVALALAVGIAALVLYLRVELIRSFTTWAALGALVFPLLLVLRAPLGGLGSATDAAPIAQASPAKAISVVMLLLDELPTLSLLDRNNEIDASLFPNLAEFASGAHWYRNAIAAGPYTDVAVPAMLTGRDQAQPSTSFRTQPENLFNLLGESHQIIAREAGTQLCPPTLCLGGAQSAADLDLAMLASDLAVMQGHLLLPHAFRARLPDIGDRWKGFVSQPEVDWEPAGLGADPSADRAREDALSKVLGRGKRVMADFHAFHSRLAPAADDRPSFFYLHLMLPHMPWRFLPSGRSYFAYDHAPRGLLRRDKSGRRTWGNDAWLIVLAEQRHLLQLAYTDRLVGTLLARLKEVGIFERAMIVIAADHGTAFVAGEPRRALEADNMSGILFVPLLVKLPGQRAGTIVDEPVSALDVLPTVAAVVELPIPWPLAGRSLFGPPRSPGSSFPLRSGSRHALSWSEFEIMLADRNARVSHKNEVFGRGEGLRKLFQIGATEAHAALIGRRVSEFAQAEAPSEWTAWIPLAGRFADLDSTTPIVPALIDGRITGRASSEGETALALSVGGRIEAVTRTFGQRGGFTSLLPESALGGGSGELGIHRITSRAGSIELARLRIVPRRPPSRAPPR